MTGAPDLSQQIMDVQQRSAVMLGCDNQREAAKLPEGNSVLEEEDALRQDAGLTPFTFNFGFPPDDHRLIALAGSHALAVGVGKHDDFKATIEIFKGQKGH